MKRRILWIEDDYFAIKGLVRPLEREGFQIDVATSAVEGFQKGKKWRSYDVVLVDLILPLASEDIDLPTKVKSWDNEKYAGIGILKWLKIELKARCPVLMLSVVRDPIAKFNLGDLQLAGCLPKRGLLPSQVKEKIFELLKMKS